MRGVSRVVTGLVVLSLLVLIAAAPAGAAGVGGGTVAGTVSPITPGVPKLGDECTTTTYGFMPIAITGAFTNGATGFAGQVTSGSVSGGSSPGAECTATGNGSVNPFSPSVSGIVVPAGSTIGGTLSGTGGSAAASAGGYSRVGTIVLVKLVGNLSINGGAAGSAIVVVAAQFTPTSGNGVTTDVTGAAFDGIYSVAIT